MNIGVVVDRKGFMSRSKEENAASPPLKGATAAEDLATLKPGYENKFIGHGNIKRFAVHFGLWNFKVKR
jgi:hypothetical protein